MIKFLIGVVIAAFIVIIGFLVIDPNLNQASNPNLNPITNSENLNAITIEGEVEKPGTYVLEDGVTMSDLILAAGGLTTNADERCYFPTAVLEEGMTYYIAPLTKNIFHSDKDTLYFHQAPLLLLSNFHLELFLVLLLIVHLEHFP